MIIELLAYAEQRTSEPLEQFRQELIAEGLDDIGEIYLHNRYGLSRYEFGLSIDTDCLDTVLQVCSARSRPKRIIIELCC